MYKRQGDRSGVAVIVADRYQHDGDGRGYGIAQTPRGDGTCLLYTSDAADDLLCVDLGGRRIIKKKKSTRQNNNVKKQWTKNHL